MSASKFFALVLFGLFACGQTSTSTAQPTSPYSFEEIRTPGGYTDILKTRDGRTVCYQTRGSNGTGAGISSIRE